MRNDCWLNRWAMVVILYLCFGMLQGCRCQETVETNVATVNGYAISFKEFWDHFKGRYDEVTDPSTLQPDVLLRMKAEVLSDLIRRRLLLQEARKRDIHVPEEQVNARVEQIREGYPGLAFQKVLLEHQQDSEQFRQALEEQLIMEMLYRQVVMSAGKVTEAEIGSYYDDHLDEFLVPETVRMRQLVVKDQALAKKLLWKIRKGQDFSVLAGEQTQVLDEEKPGSLETYRRGELPEALEAVAFSAKKGQVTGPVESPYGFHLIRVEEKVPAHLPALEEVREKISKQLQLEREEQEYARWIENRIMRSQIKVHESLRGAMRQR